MEYGKWELKLEANPDGSSPIQHLSEVKIIVRNNNGELLERLSPWASYVVQPPNRSEGTTFKQRIWHPAPDKVQIRTKESKKNNMSTELSAM